MKKVGLLLCFMLINGVCAIAQIPPADMKKTVGFIFGQAHVKDATGTTHTIDAALGTGFFVLYPDTRGGPDWVFVYFVTAKHVLKDTDGTFVKKIRVRLNLLQEQNGVDFDYQDVPVSDEQGRLIWFQDANDSSDEAVAIPLLPDIKRFDLKALPISMFATTETLKKENVSEGDSVFFIGLMPQFYGSVKNVPVIRKGSLALLTDEPVPTPQGHQRGYICELGGWPGNSGSPVFLSLGGVRGGVITAGERYFLLGLLISYYNNSRSVETIDTATLTLNDPSNIGLAFVLPSERIKQILDGPTAQQRRDQEVEQHNQQSPPK